MKHVTRLIVQVKMAVTEVLKDILKQNLNSMQVSSFT